MAKEESPAVLTIDGREVRVTHPSKLYFSREVRLSKLDLVRYYLAVAEGALRGAGGRPNMLVRYPNGVDGDFFFQKRAPAHRPAWLRTVELRFPSGRTAEEVVPDDAAAHVAKLDGRADGRSHFDVDRRAGKRQVDDAARIVAAVIER